MFAKQKCYYIQRKDYNCTSKFDQKPAGQAMKFEYLEVICHLLTFFFGFWGCQGDRGDGVKGEQGEPGETGPQGAPGPPGPTAPSKTEKVSTFSLCKWS